MISAIVWLVLGFVLLIWGGDILVRGASGIALRAKLSPMIVGLTVVSIGTSAPELFVSISAALDGKPEMSMGNVIGSNIANLGLVLGITAMILPIPVERKILKLEWPVMMFATLLLWFFIYNGTLSKIEGGIFVGLLFAFILYLVYISRGKSDDTEALETDGKMPIWKLILYPIIGTVGLKFGADWLIDGASFIAKEMGISDHVISVTLIAFGTSVPELAASIIAALRGETDISIGNLIGSNIFNIFCVLGFTSIIHPLAISANSLLDMWWVVAIALALLPMIYFKPKIGRYSGIVLLLGYAAYIYSVFG